MTRRCGCLGDGLRSAACHTITGGRTIVYTTKCACICDAGIGRFRAGVAPWTTYYAECLSNPDVIEFYCTGSKYRADVADRVADSANVARLTLWECTKAERRLAKKVLQLSDGRVHAYSIPLGAGAISDSQSGSALVPAWVDALHNNAQVLRAAKAWAEDKRGRLPETDEEWRKIVSWVERSSDPAIVA